MYSNKHFLILLNFDPGQPFVNVLLLFCFMYRDEKPDSYD